MNEETVTSLMGRTVGHYRISQFIGRGGMGEVYLGYDTKLKRDVAIKVLPSASAANPMARARFVREARLASRVVHPYVATLFDVAESGGDLFLIMEHIRGRTLEAILGERHSSRRRRPRWPKRWSKRSAQSTARGSFTATSSPAT
jgi:serine/threonine-protein kinase